MPARRTAASGCVRPRSRCCSSAVPGGSWRCRAAGMTSKLAAVTMTSRVVMLTSWITSRSRTASTVMWGASSQKRPLRPSAPSLGVLRQAPVAREAPDDDVARQPSMTKPSAQPTRLMPLAWMPASRPSGPSPVIDGSDRTDSHRTLRTAGPCPATPAAVLQPSPHDAEVAGTLVVSVAVSGWCDSDEPERQKWGLLMA